MSNLLILDINGVFCTKTRTGEIPKDSKLEHLKLNKYYVTLRPNARKFLEFCFENYIVAFFSSTTPTNSKKILEKLLTEEQQTKTKFQWFRDRTHFDPDYPKCDEFATIKKLSDVWDNPTVNEKRAFSEKNTLLCDDSVTKTRFNPKTNVIVIPPFNGDENDVALLDKINEIKHAFDVLADRFGSSNKEEKL